MDRRMETVRRLLKEAGTLIRHSRPQSVSVKSTFDYVTDLDEAVDVLLTEGLARWDPAIPVLSEERAFEGTAPPDTLWLIDPVDGTHNLMADIPFFAVCVALIEKGGISLAAVYDIMADRLFWAMDGLGAFCNDRALHLPGDPPALIACSTGALDALAADAALYTQCRSIGKLRNLGCQSLHLCAVASGVVAAALSKEAKIWDDAAGRYIAEQAGAEYASFASQESLMTAFLSKSEMRSLCLHPRLAPSLLAPVQRLFGSEG
ncbi:MAG: inositol monophosphatase family protein [Pseudomonadota bacterium]